MSKHTRIYLVRHGETLWNFEKRFQGIADIPLNEKGIAQAEATGAWFAANQSQFDAIYASPLIRAAQTADIIGRQINHTASPTPLLKEINCGEWEGLDSAKIEAQYPGQLAQWRANVETHVIPGGECMADVQKRAWSFYEECLASHTGDTIMLVAHGATLIAMICSMMGWDLSEKWRDRTTRLDNASISTFLYDGETKTHTMQQFNFTEHLAEIN